MANRGARSKVAVGAGAALGATVVFAPAAEAATFTVTNLNDAGAGSLRQAIIDANAATGGDVITFASGLTGAITLATGEIDILEGVDIQGPGAAAISVSGNNASRIFYVNPDTNGTAGEAVKISGLTLTQGNTVNNGGALYAANATLTLSNLVATGNQAGNYGGAVMAFSTSLSVDSSAMSGNTADGDGGAMYRDENDHGAEVIRNSTFTNNTAGDDGGAITLYQATNPTLIENTTIAGNSAVHAGAIDNYDSAAAGDLTIRGSTISGNQASDNAGGIYHLGEGGLTISNTTISGNTAVTEAGGLHLYGIGAGETARVQNSTISGNTAATGGGIHLSDDPLTLSSTIVANNVAATGPDLFDDADVTSLFDTGFSLIESTAGANITENPAGSNIFGTDPLLGALAANGGPTQTHLPALTSPAIDAGIANGLATDQRGFARTADLAVTANRAGSDATDIGAVEIRAAACQGANALAEFNATAGDDVLTGTEGSDSIAGLAGNDTAKGAGGKDCLSGDEGNDKLRGQGGNDQVKGADGDDNASGGGGDDKVVGGAGKDKVKGADGKDKLKGNAGKDKLKAADGAKDKVNCGGGEDKATVDAKDKVAANCEDVTEKA